MKYIKLTNKGTVNRLLLEVIGLGTKKSKTNNGISVGQWQSGFKLATPAALRLGIDVVASSEDTNGPYILSFEILPISFIHENVTIESGIIRYVYSDGTIKDISISIDAFPEFDKPIGDDDNSAYPSLREYIANARDEDIDYKIETNVTEICQAPRGYTVIYIEQREELLEMLDRLSIRYFKFLEEIPLLIVPELGAIYPKSEKGKTRFFNHGYLVGCQEKDDFGGSCFDYDVFGKDIVNEMRWIKDEYSFNKRLAKLFCRIDEYDLLKTIIAFAVQNPFAYEGVVFGLVEQESISDEFKALCQRVWSDIFGKNAYLKSDNAFIDANAETMGFKSVSPGYNLNIFLKKAGILTVKDVIRDRLRNILFRDPDANEKARIFSIIERYISRIKFYRESSAKYPVKIMKDPSGMVNGLALQFEEICIEEKLLEGNDSDILLTYLHELRHCLSKRTDSDFREFMHYADMEIRFLFSLLRVALDALEKKGAKLSSIHDEFADLV
ncbi:MAG: hypothetical protein COU51_03270 [Parcubacteria group bacterium CG10_big_fil_rev_8_21_14_0_10_36_14]|nr:MAG: hypothetical protein COU51_03270 [Parcubacteria group bacterium CG10_big_fil_rev_8_21_14_0_10_36_14]